MIIAELGVCRLRPPSWIQSKALVSPDETVRVVDLEARRQMVGDNDAAVCGFGSVIFSTTTSRAFCFTLGGSTLSPASV